MKQIQRRKAKGRVAKSVLRLPDLESREVRGSQQSVVPGCAAGLSPRHRRIRGLVLLRTAAFLQQDSGRSVSDAPGVTTSRPWDYQPPSGGGSSFGVRGRRLRHLSADLAAGIRRVKGVKKLGVRLGNWLTAEQGITLWQAPDRERLKGKRDRALLSALLACGLRRHEVAELAVDHVQQHEDIGRSLT